MRRLLSLWRHEYDVIVTWRHRWRHRSTRRRHLPVGSLLSRTPKSPIFRDIILASNFPTQTDTSTDNKGRLKLAAREPVIQRARVCGRCCWCQAHGDGVQVATSRGTTWRRRHRLWCALGIGRSQTTCRMDVFSSVLIDKCLRSRSQSNNFNCLIGKLVRFSACI